jgi:hypothetical protein
MSGYDVFAIIVLLVLAASAIVIVLIVGGLPGYIARGRRHPYAQAVGIAGWVALIFVPLWPLALVWAYVDVPRPGSSRQSDLDDLRRRLVAVEGALRIREAAE